MIGILSASEIEEILRQNRLGRLAICTASFPYVVPITYAYDGQAVFGFSGPGQKIENMRAQPNVALLVDEIRTPTHWKSVIVEGIYDEVIDPAERMQASSIIMSRTRQLVTRGLSDEPGLVLFRIMPERKSGRFESGSH
ncbi:MAG: pyridoxamine 5'-phosphate oxidase family protein [Thermomicrobiales bacterium]